MNEAPKDERAWALLDLGRAYDRNSQAGKALERALKAMAPLGKTDGADERAIRDEFAAFFEAVA